MGFRYLANNLAPLLFEKGKLKYKERKMDALAAFGRTAYSTLNTASTDMAVLVQNTALSLMKIEPALNLYGKIPLINLPTAYCRLTIAFSQGCLSIASLGITTASGIASYFGEAAFDSTQHLLQAEMALRMGTNAALNLVRFIAEFMPVISTAVCAPWDYLMSGTQLINYLPQGGIQLFS